MLLHAASVILLTNIKYIYLPEECKFRGTLDLYAVTTSNLYLRNHNLLYPGPCYFQRDDICGPVKENFRWLYVTAASKYNFFTNVRFMDLVL